MLVVGLTGGIGCGKSLVSDLFYDLFSTPIIDADVIARELTQTRPVVNQIAQQLGTEYLDENNHLLRQKLREVIFTDPSSRSTLEKILHPLVFDKIEEDLTRLDAPYCLVVIPLLFEKERTEFLDRILVIDCTIEEQISRVTQRDRCNDNLVKNIIKTQIDRNSRLSLADDIIENSGSITSVKNKIIMLNKKYTEFGKAVR
ncbi:MAG: dephospho-CoA kinase [Gammaproteobacteria bacterium]